MDWIIIIILLQGVAYTTGEFGDMTRKINISIF